MVLLQGALVANESPFLETLMHFQSVPKAELHLHLGGAYPKEYLFSIATEEQKRELEEKLELIANGVDYHDVFRVFQIISQLVNSEEKIEEGVKALCVALQKDGVSYAEIRTGLKDLGKGFEAYLSSVLSGIKAMESELFQARLFLSLQRNSSLEAVKTTIDLALKYKNQGIIGIDISGDSTIGEINFILPELIRAKEAGLPFVVHMGEAPGEIEQIALLEALQPVRIGHGVYLSDEAKEWIVQHQTPIEVCLTSSVLVKMIDHYRQHPGLEFFRLGHPVVLCTDDPLLFSTTLSKEFAIGHLDAGLSMDHLERLAQDAFHYVVPRVDIKGVDMVENFQFVGCHDPILDSSSCALELSEILDPKMQHFLDAMLEFARGEQSDSQKGVLVGLAAPQIGKPLRIILVDVKADGKGGVAELRVYINPEIVEVSEEIEPWYEACFSTGIVRGIVHRHSRVTIKALDRQGNEINESHHGYVARIFQHEIDHLNGVRFPDRIDPDGSLHIVNNDQLYQYRNLEGWRDWKVTIPQKNWKKYLQD